MNCCDLTPVITHNEASLKFTNELKFFTFLYLGFCIFKILLFQGGDFLTELIILILLLLTFTQCYFYTAMFALFLILFQLFFQTFSLLLILQDYLLNLANIGVFVIVIEIISFTLYLLLVRSLFKAYREYKALFFEQASGGRVYNRFNDGGNDVELNNMDNNSEGKKKFVPFSGKGQTWG